MPAKKLTLLLAYLNAVFFVSQLWCAPAGKITGKISDVQTGEALPGANVLLKGTSLGASTDINGEYTIINVPDGSYTLRVSYVGYKSAEVTFQLNDDETIKRDLKLEPVGVQGHEVVVTAQAQGQNAAINQQLSAMQIANIVSAARIKDLPDANAAESIGRLPGVYLVRSYGEGAQVAIRGLEPKYNQILIDGVEMPANTITSSSSTDRSVDLSMISSDMLSGIEVYKSVTPDMDAAVLGGAVNFQIKKAQGNESGLPALHLSAQGGYNHLQNAYNDYKLVTTAEQRFLDNKLGILVDGIIERQNLTADIYGGGFYQKNSSNYYKPADVLMHSINLNYKPTEQSRYNGTFVMDYKWGDGNVTLMNTFSKGKKNIETFGQNYGMSDNNYINFSASANTPINNQITNILDVQQDLLSFNVDAKISHAYAENITPGYWSVTFNQTSGVSMNSIDPHQFPEAIAKQASAQVDTSKMVFSGINTNSSFSRQRNIRGSLDIEKAINLSYDITATLKFGGAYQYTFRAYDYSAGSGTLGTPGNTGARAAVVAAYPWMAEPPYNMNPNGSTLFPISMFFDKNRNFGNFLNGDYPMLTYPLNTSLLSQVVNIVENYQRDKPYAVSNAYSPDAYANIANDYLGYEYRSAEYAMATINIGPQITIIPGVRYQGLKTSYTAAHIPAAYNNNTYPNPFPHTDTTVTQYHGYWLPDITLRYRMFTWLDMRFAYTNTLTYPDFGDIVPILHIFTQSVDWNNYLLKPGRSQNFDFSLSVYNNEIGLFTVNPFLKRINDLIFPSGTVHITDPSQYPGLPDYTRTYALNTMINNPNRVDLWGIEADWQTHFWYLPDPFKGLILDVNYTHIFSNALYPFVMRQDTGSFPRYGVKYIDTTYSNRLLDQPTNIINLTLGYDYAGFSVRFSMKYQADVFKGTQNIWTAFDKYITYYRRWDFNVKQKLPWYGLEAFFDINNLNGEPDINVIHGNGYPTSEQSYGLTADLGLRWSF